MQWKNILLFWLLAVNLFGLALMGVDKHRARCGAWRVRERTLFLCALLGGAVGAWAGMLLFRHKTQHISFMAGIPAILVAQLLLVIWGLLGFPFPGK